MRVFIILIGGALLLALLGFIFYFVNTGKSLDIFKNEGIITTQKEFKTVVPGQLTVLTNVPFEPMEYINEKGELVGFDIDLIKAIAKKLNLKLVIEQKDWDLMFELVRTHKVDLAVSGITITDERSTKYNFSVPYLNAGQVIITPTGNPGNIHTGSDLKEKNIIAQKNTTGAEVAIDMGARIIERDQIGDQEVQDVISKNADGIVVDYIVGAQLVKKNKNIQIAGPQITEEYYGVMFPDSEYALVEAINTVMRDMKRDGELNNIESRWIQ